jgi:hypothetical protein
MTAKFKVGDHVRWNSEAGRVSGRIVKVHTKDFDYKGHTHHASKDEPQYEIRSDKSTQGLGVAQDRLTGWSVVGWRAVPDSALAECPYHGGSV